MTAHRGNRGTGENGPAEQELAAPDWMDGLLRDAARREPHIDDAGFTASVIARLPSGAPSAARRWILLGFGLFACLFGLGVFGGAAFIWNAMLEAISHPGFGPHQLTVLVFAALFYWYLFSSLSGRPGRD